MSILKLNGISPAKGSHRETKRLGRGQGTGQGCTAGKGDKGARSRSGERVKFYFEGGQTPMTRRVPKRGFNNSLFTVKYQIVNVGDIEKCDLSSGKDIDPAWLFENNLVRSSVGPVKILGNGDLSKKIVIKADSFSKSAREKIEKAKGKAEVITRA
jgi:large subunit ribosomal protein L15